MPRSQLSDRLEAFATTLDPDPDAMAQIRSDLVTRAAIAARPRTGFLGLAMVAPVARFFDGTRAAFAESPARFRRVQRVAYVAGTAALVLSMAAGTAAASRPGAPLYGPRLWLEKVTLPASGPERASRELALLEARLQEARDAAAQGDAAALAAALDAYNETAKDIAANAGSDASRLDAALSHHVNVLQGLLGETGGKSEAAIQTAIDRARVTISEIEARQENGGNGSGSGGDENGNGGNGGGPGNGAGNGGSNNGAGNGGSDNGNGTDNQPTPRPTPQPTPAHPTPQSTPAHPTPLPHPTPRS